MIDHDKCIGEMLDLLDELGIADDTFVRYSTDNGPHMNTWPDAGTTPFRNEKNSSWEGAYRVPCMVRFPGKIKAGSESQRDHQPPGLVAHHPRGGGEPDIKEKLKKGLQDRQEDLQGPSRRLQPDAVLDRQGRRARARASSTSPTTAISLRCATTTGRWCSWSSAAGHAARSGPEPFVILRMPKIFNLRMDPYERADDHVEHLLRLDVQAHLPARSRPGGRGGVPGNLQGIPAAPEGGELRVDQVVEKMTEAAGSGGR